MQHSSLASSDKSSERGGIVSFIVISVMLIGLVAGGLYLVYGRSVQIANTTPEISQLPEKTSEPKPDPERNPVKTPEDKPSTSTQNAPTQTIPVPQPASSSEQIAETGPAETVATMLVFGAIAASSTMYLQSRRSHL